MPHRILGPLEGICYCVHFTPPLVSGGKDKLAKLFVSLFAQRLSESACGVRPFCLG